VEGFTVCRGCFFRPDVIYPDILKEAARGLRQVRRYLGRHAEFDEWLAKKSGETATR
jgi:hypothetical protein